MLQLKPFNQIKLIHDKSVNSRGYIKKEFEYFNFAKIQNNYNNSENRRKKK